MLASRTALIALALSTLCASAHAELSLEACSDAYTDGQEDRLAGRVFSARARFEQCKDASCPDAIVEDCKRWLAEVEAELPTVVIAATNLAGAPIAHLSVSIDGVPVAPEALSAPIVVDAGAHVFRLTAPGFAAARIERSLRPEDRAYSIHALLHPPRPHARSSAARRARAPAPATPAPTSFPVLASVLAGVGVVSLGSAVYFGVSAKRRYDQLETECAPHCSGAQGDSVRSKMLLSDLALATSVVALGASAWIFFSARTEPSTVAVSLEPRRDGGQLQLRLRF